MKKSVLSAAALAVLGLLGAHALKAGEGGVSQGPAVTVSAASSVMPDGVRAHPTGPADADAQPSVTVVEPSRTAATEPSASLVSLALGAAIPSDPQMPRIASTPVVSTGGHTTDSAASEAPDFGEGLLALAGGNGLGDGTPGAFVGAGGGFGYPNLTPTGSICQAFGGGSCDLSNVSASEFLGGESGGKSARFSADEFAVSGAITAPIPEPSTYALMFIGLVIIGAAVRRRCNDQE